MTTGLGVFFEVAIALDVEAEAADEPFLVVNGEFIDSRLDGDGEVVVDFRRLLRRCNTTLSGEGSKTISATRGDSVSLKAKSSVSVCLEALMTSTHFSVQIPISRKAVGSGGSSISLQSPTPMERVVVVAAAGVGLAPTALRNLSLLVSASCSRNVQVAQTTGNSSNLH